MRILPVRLLVTASLLLFCSGAFAQSFGQDEASGSGSHGISATGTAQIERLPTTLRLQVDVLSKGPTLKEALANLKTRTEAAKAKVLSLGAQAGSVKVDAPRMSTDKSGQQRQMEMMIAARMRNRGKKGSKPAKPTTVNVSASLTAEWPLTAQDAEQLLIAAHTLQETIKGADLAGKEAAAKLSPEEQEVQEEMGEAMQSYNSGEDSKPGEPVFVFVCPISMAEREKALAEAFKKAQEEATQLARATGRELGELKTVSGSVTSGGEDESGTNYQMMMLMRGRGMAARGKSDDKLEAMNVQPGMVKCTAMISISFGLKPAKK